MALGSLPGERSPDGVLPALHPTGVRQQLCSYLAALGAAQDAPQQGRLGRVFQRGMAAYWQAAPKAVAEVCGTHPLGALLGRLHSLMLQQQGIREVASCLKGAAPHVQSYGGGGDGDAATIARVCGGLRRHRHGQRSVADVSRTKQSIGEEVRGVARVAVCVVVSAPDAEGQHRALALGHSGQGSATLRLPPVHISAHLGTRRGVGQESLDDGSFLLHGQCEGAPPLVACNSDASFIFEVGV